MYQIEALCSRALWVDAGRLRMDGDSADVTSAYSASLNADALTGTGATSTLVPGAVAAGAGLGRIVHVTAEVDGKPVPKGSAAQVLSGQSTLALTLGFSIDPTLPTPALALGISDANEPHGGQRYHSQR